MGTQMQMGAAGLGDLNLAATDSGGYSSLLLLALPLVLLGFLMWNQRRRTRELETIQKSLTVGEEVMTSSGMLGRLTALDDEIATIEVAPGVQVRFDRRAVTRPPARPSVGGAAPEGTSAGGPAAGEEG